MREIHIVSRNEFLVEKHFGDKVSLPIETVVKLTRLIRRDMGGGEENALPSLRQSVRLRAARFHLG